MKHNFLIHYIFISTFSFFMEAIVLKGRFSLTQPSIMWLGERIDSRVTKSPPKYEF